MSLIAVVDTETTGFDPKKDRVIEASWALVDVDTAKIVVIGSRIWSSPTNDAEAVNGIPVSLLSTYGAPFKPASFDAPVDAILAHNAAFDRQWNAFDSTAPWLCTKDDFEWPACASGKKLIEVALAHGVGVVSAHRAFADVLTLCLTLERAHEKVPLREMLAKAGQPRKTYAALVSYDDREKARAAGFSWQSAAKLWTKRLTAEAANSLPFKVREVA